MLTYAFIFIAALLTSFALTPFVRNRARWLGLIDHPSEARQLHTSPIPRAGGIAIFIAFIFALTLIFCFGNLVERGFRTELPYALRILVPCLAMFLLGLVDDVRRLP